MNAASIVGFSGFLRSGEFRYAASDQPASAASRRLICYVPILPLATATNTPSSRLSGAKRTSSTTESKSYSQPPAPPSAQLQPSAGYSQRTCNRSVPPSFGSPPVPSPTNVSSSNSANASQLEALNTPHHSQGIASAVAPLKQHQIRAG